MQQRHERSPDEGQALPPGLRKRPPPAWPLSTQRKRRSNRELLGSGDPRREPAALPRSDRNRTKRSRPISEIISAMASTIVSATDVPNSAGDSSLERRTVRAKRPAKSAIGATEESEMRDSHILARPRDVLNSLNTGRPPRGGMTTSVHNRSFRVFESGLTGAPSSPIATIDFVRPHANSV